MFNAAFVISLRRRPDRLERFQSSLPTDWPYPTPIVHPAIDGRLCQPPDYWLTGAGAWGCYKSHLQILERCLNCGIKSVLILEDDALFGDHLAYRSHKFFSSLPRDWGMVYLGGQLLFTDIFPPKKVNRFVYQPYNVHRTHAYAVRGSMIEVLYRHLSRRDWIANHQLDGHYGRLCESGQWPIYCPWSWLAKQRLEQSDVNPLPPQEFMEAIMPDPYSYDQNQQSLLVLDFNRSESLICRFLTALGVAFVRIRNPEDVADDMLHPRVISVDGSIEDVIYFLRFNPNYLAIDSDDLRSPRSLILRIARYFSLNPSPDQIGAALALAKENPRSLPTEGSSFRE